MCTVTFVPTTKGVCVTSNRDEKNMRGEALFPSVYRQGNTTLLYPKDANQGGTWIAAKDDGDAAVLLNGGFIPHTPVPPYRQSRGTIIPLALSADDPMAFFEDYNCEDIEPFTLVLFAAQRLYEYRWTGVIKHRKQLNPAKMHIWSSVTLYDETTIRRRRSWFERWQYHHENPEQTDIIRFHHFAGDGDAANDLLMNRDNKIYTVSITSLLIGNEQTEMHYMDTLNDVTSRKELRFAYSFTSKTLC